ncbi:MAG TPA: sigma 54-interacting transcriptional regulator [Terriglobales bacterium]|nr:sigma 54-interacting transcriptional regulator [Terriglobales bacterium]
MDSEGHAPSRRSELPDLALRLENLNGVLNTLTDVLDIREVFDQVSQVVQRVLPHDLMGVMEISQGGERMRLYAGTEKPFLTYEGAVSNPEILTQPWESMITEDLPNHPVAKGTPALKLGMVTALSAPICFGGRLQAMVNFFSREPGWFRRDDLPIAERVASHIAVAMSHHRLAEEARMAAEANARAERLEVRVQQLTEELDARGGYRRVIGESAAWREILNKATQVAATEATVLLLGESGTGKEVIARFIHRGSARRDRPFVALNCAALPEHLMEAEIFGFEAGAFTGALKAKPGQIEAAAGGVLFLDEIGEMTLTAQAKFLRVLQEREFQRLGGNRVLHADVRVIAATNRDLRKAIQRGGFREDLYYRLNVFELRLPPLRERRDDILPLTDAFVAEIGRSIGVPPAGVSLEARQSLVQYHWPGNVRELRNTLERAAILASGGLIVSEHLALSPHPEAKPQAIVSSTQDSRADAPSDLSSVERAMIKRALEETRFNKSIAAKKLGLTRAQLYTRLKRYGLD